jgi:chromosome segregation protein
VRERLGDDLGLDPDAAMRDARAARAEGPLAGGEGRDEELAEAEERLARKIGLLGTINPLALEEHRQLEERHAFLTEQLYSLGSAGAYLM